MLRQICSCLILILLLLSFPAGSDAADLPWLDQNPYLSKLFPSITSDEWQGLQVTKLPGGSFIRKATPDFSTAVRGTAKIRAGTEVMLQANRGVLRHELVYRSAISLIGNMRKENTLIGFDPDMIHTNTIGEFVPGDGRYSFSYIALNPYDVLKLRPVGTRTLSQQADLFIGGFKSNYENQYLGTVLHEATHLRFHTAYNRELKKLGFNRAARENFPSFYAAREEYLATIVGMLMENPDVPISELRAEAEQQIRRNYKQLNADEIGVLPSTTFQTVLGNFGNNIKPVLRSATKVGVTTAAGVILGDAAPIVEQVIIHKVVLAHTLLESAKCTAGLAGPLLSVGAPAMIGAGSLLAAELFWPQVDIRASYRGLDQFGLRRGESPLTSRKFSTISCHNVWLRGGY